MNISPIKPLILSIVLAAAGTLTASSQIVNWNAYSDFYLSPTAAGWGGATNPSAAGAAWGYYMGNVNGNGPFPTNTGTYLSPSQIYKYSSYDPLGAGGPVYSTSGWANTGGAGFAAYTDNVPWGAPGDLHSSLGSYPTPWFAGAPGFSQGLTNLMWMQSVWLGGASLEGIASMVTWTAPYTTNYTFTGLFVAGDQAGNGASVAIIDSLSAALLTRTALAPNASTSFSFTNSYNAGDIVQFQVGSDFKTGNAVGMQLDIQAVPEPGTVAYLAFALAGLALWPMCRRALANRQSVE